MDSSGGSEESEVVVLDQPSKQVAESSGSKSSGEGNEEILALFERLKAHYKKNVEEREAPKTAEDYESDMARERKLLEETSFRQKYKNKLDSTCDFTEVKWGSPIKVGNTSSVQSPLYQSSALITSPSSLSSLYR